jgi:hypothetical protein
LEAVGLAEVVNKYRILNDNNDGFLKVEDKEMGMTSTPCLFHLAMVIIF